MTDCVNGGSKKNPCWRDKDCHAAARWLDSTYVTVLEKKALRDLKRNKPLHRLKIMEVKNDQLRGAHQEMSCGTAPSV